MHPIIERIKMQTSELKLRSPVSIEVVAEVERRIGFPLPDLIRELYTGIADGGFGPSYGFLPLLTPVPEIKMANGSLSPVESVTELYELFKKGDPEDSSWVWPDRLLPMVEWGCAIRSCVDCHSPSLQVFRDEPYVSRLMESPSLEAWLSSWLNGQNLWNMKGS